MQSFSLANVIFAAIVLSSVRGFTITLSSKYVATQRPFQISRQVGWSIKMQVASNNESIDPSTLMDMDIVLFSLKSDGDASLQLGAIEEGGTLAPLSAWTEESQFGDSIEFLVHEDDRWLKELDMDNVILHSVLAENLISYGSRQVGGGKGPGNPHGEESELIYYIEREVITSNNIDIVLKPDLEILW